MADDRSARRDEVNSDELASSRKLADESDAPTTEADRIRWANELAAADESAVGHAPQSDVDVTPTPVDERAPVVATPNAPPVDDCTLDASTELGNEVPVPVAMSPAEIDQRGQIVDAMCEEPPKPPPREPGAEGEA